MSRHVHRFFVVCKKLLRHKESKRYLLSGVIVVLLILASILLYRAMYNSQIYAALSNIRTLSRTQALHDKNIAQINTLFGLPPDQDTLQVATIKDKKALGEKEKYFTKARNGDVLIIYPAMTIIYDPTTQSVVDIAQVNLLK